jgi:2-hydroxy-3-keto-5-methylthiopentenyl-1-phosphate phosphatase
MPKSETLHTKYEGFAVSKDAEVRQVLDEKYERFQRAGAAMVRLETDWDDTIGQGTWPIVRTALNDSDAELQSRLYKWHRGPLSTGVLKFDESRSWQKAALGMLVGEPIEPILEAVREEAGGLRDGSGELYEYCKEKGIPFIVKSASTRQFIEAASEAGGIQPDVIIATELITDGQTPNEGRILSWKFNTMTHSHNKGTITSDKLVAIEQARPHVIGLGDGTFDRMMIHPKHQTLWVRANGGYMQHSDEWDSYLAESFSHLHVFDKNSPEVVTYPPYDFVSVEPDLVATNGLIRQLF